MASLKPLQFRVYNFRNIDDSDWIDLANVTALVGRNESGKTTLLKALHKFNPVTEQPYKPQREFPRDRFTRDFKNAVSWPVCAVKFQIDATFHAELGNLIDGAEPPKTVIFTRHYDGELYCELEPKPVETKLTYDLVVTALENFKAAAMRLPTPAPDHEITTREFAQTF